MKETGLREVTKLVQLAQLKCIDTWHLITKSSDSKSASVMLRLIASKVLYLEEESFIS